MRDTFDDAVHRIDRLMSGGTTCDLGFSCPIFGRDVASQPAGAAAPTRHGQRLFREV
jgi:hypothetical protein